MKLFNYYRSTASYRVRIALNYKNLDYEIHDIQLIDKDGRKAEQYSDNYKKINPQQLVPSLILDNGSVITQSVAILEYLEEEYPKPNILPSDKLERAYVRQLVNIISNDIHPLNNLRVLQYLKNNYQSNESDKLKWYHNWLKLGFKAFEKLLEQRDSNGKYCHGNNVSMADICLIPQVYNAKRFDFDMSEFELIESINSNCMKIKAFDKAKP